MKLAVAGCPLTRRHPDKLPIGRCNGLAHRQHVLLHTVETVTLVHLSAERAMAGCGCGRTCLPKTTHIKRTATYVTCLLGLSYVSHLLISITPTAAIRSGMAYPSHTPSDTCFRL